MTITDMALPDEVVEAAADAFTADRKRRGGSWELSMPAAIRATLQALVDNGSAKIITACAYWPDNPPFIAIRLDSDERERALQEERK